MSLSFKRFVKTSKTFLSNFRHLQKSKKLEQPWYLSSFGMTRAVGPKRVLPLARISGSP